MVTEDCETFRRCGFLVCLGFLLGWFGLFVFCLVLLLGFFTRESQKIKKEYQGRDVPESVA